jgi:ribosome-binding factor A
MGQRVVRVNELLKREISHVVHTRFQAEAVDISVLGVDVAPNLRTAVVFYATHGDDSKRGAAKRFFDRNGEAIRREVGKAVTLKYLPHLDFRYDVGADHGERLNQLLDDLGLEGEPGPQSSEWEED